MAKNQQTPTTPPPYYMRPKKSRWWIPVVVIASVIAVIVIFLIVVIAVAGSAFEQEPYQVKKNSVLYVNTAGTFNEEPNQLSFNFMKFQSKPSFSNLIQAIKKAKEDDRIKGIYLKSGLSQIGYAKAKELKEALEEFKESGKFIYGYIDAGRELDYYLALPSDSLYTTREGMIELNGYSITSLFMKGFMKKLGVDFTVMGFEDFKSAGETLSRNKFSDSARYQYKVLIESKLDEFVKAVCEKRDIKESDFIEILSNGVYRADSLLSKGLIDGIQYEPEIKRTIRKSIVGEKEDEKEDESVVSKLENKVKFVSVNNYLQDTPPAKPEQIAEESKKIAIIYASGEIQQNMPEGAFGSDEHITPKEFAEYLKKARDDEDVKGVIIRINSPGGSAMASDEIYNEVLKTREEKPVYVSMSDVAASGGYYIAVAGDTIVAQPNTITGSIGVILALPNFTGTLDKLDITADTISTGSAAKMMVGVMPYRKKDLDRLESIAEGIYHRFVNKVAENRGMKFQEARALAKGRVWTGKDAYDRNLVDALGGLGKAISLMKKRIGVPDTMKVYVKKYPRAKEPIELILEAFGMGNNGGGLESLAPLAKSIGYSPNEFYSAYKAMPPEMKESLKRAYNLYQMSQKEKVLTIVPETFNIE